MTYNVKSHPSPFRYSLHINQLEPKHQTLMLDWARRLDRDERHDYRNGFFYAVLPFEKILAPEAWSPSRLGTYLRRLSRLDFLGDQQRIHQHIAQYPDHGWTMFNQTVDTYFEMLMFLHHLRAALKPEMVAPRTLAVYMELG